MSHDYVIVALLEEREPGDTFRTSDWPLHLTVVAPFASFEPPDALGSALGEFAGEHVSIAASVGERAMFGARHSVPVVLIEPRDALRELHLSALAWLEERGVEFRADRHSGVGYQPHATVRGQRALAAGQAVSVRALALIDRAPDGDRGVRRIIAVAPLGG